MRILLAQNSVYIPACGGANKSNRLLLEALAKRGHACYAVASGAAVQGAQTREAFLGELASRRIAVQRTTADADIFRVQQVEVHAARSAAHLRVSLVNAVREIDPTWVLVSSEDPGQNLLQSALQAAPRRVVFLAGTTMTLPFGPDAAVQSPRQTQLLLRTAAVVCVSEFLKSYIQRWAGYASPECLPIALIENECFTPPESIDGGFVTIINPCAIKGISIFLELARRNPHLSFAAVPSWGTTCNDLALLTQLSNVTILPSSENVNSIFEQTRVLLVPSLWAEAWGRVVLEGMLRGIPVVASNLGGIPEAKLGVPYLIPTQPIISYAPRLDDKMIPAAIVPEQNLEPWIQALDALTSAPSHYSDISSASMTAARSFLAGHTIEKLETYLKNLESATTTEHANSHCAPVTARSKDARTAKSEELRRVIDGLSLDRRRLLLRLLAEKTPTVGASITPQAAGDAETSTVTPLSFAQERLWFLHQLHPESVAYNVAQAFRLRGPLNRNALEQAVNEIVARHSVLRTIFPGRDGRPVAVCTNSCRVPLAVVDLAALPSHDRGSVMQRLGFREVKRPFSLSDGPVLRVILMDMGPQEHVLLLVAHHIVADAWSFTLFADELSAAYSAILGGRSAPLLPLTIQYSDYAVWHRDELTHGNLAVQIDYWKRQLGGSLPALHLPADFTHSVWPNEQGAACRFTLDDANSRKLNELARREGVSLYMVLLAAYELMLSWLSGQSDFGIACPIANRTRTETERLIGFFVNTLVMRARVSATMTARDLLQAVRDTALAAYAHQDVPFERLVEEIRPERNLGSQPLCRVLFVLQNVPSRTLRLDTIEMEAIDFDLQTVRFDLELVLFEQNAAVSGKLVYRTSMFTSSTATRMLNGFLAALEELLSPEGRLVPEMQANMGLKQALHQHATRQAIRQVALAELTHASRQS